MVLERRFRASRKWGWVSFKLSVTHGVQDGVEQSTFGFSLDNMARDCREHRNTAASVSIDRQARLEQSVHTLKT